MSRKHQNRSNYYTYQNRMYNNDINFKDIITQKNLVNDYDEKNNYIIFRENYNNLISNFGENNWSRENHGRDPGENYNTNRIIKNQANFRQNNHSNNNQRNRNNISPNDDKHINYDKHSNEHNSNNNSNKENHPNYSKKNFNTKPETKKIKTAAFGEVNL